MKKPDLINHYAGIQPVKVDREVLTSLKEAFESAGLLTGILIFPTEESIKVSGILTGK
jgi:hypothetical protein